MLTEIAKARKCGQVRFHCIYDQPLDLNQILALCHLRAEADKLIAVNRDQAVAVLVRWLHHDLAYNTALMSAKMAHSLATGFLQEFADGTSRFLTNGRWFESSDTWEPMTESVFDGGLLIVSGSGNETRHVCLWFEDED